MGRSVLVGCSPYLDALLTSGLAESAQAGDEVRVGDAGTDGRAVEAIVDCFYSGKLALSSSSVTAVIGAANMLQVGAIEKAANAFFVEKLEPASAAEALGFAAQRIECGEAARELHEMCNKYALEHFVECVESGSLLELPAEALVPLLGSGDLAVDSEEQVLEFVQAWIERDTAGRRAALKELAPLIRFPLLTAAITGLKVTAHKEYHNAYTEAIEDSIFNDPLFFQWVPFMGVAVVALAVYAEHYWRFHRAFPDDDK